MKKNYILKTPLWVAGTILITLALSGCGNRSNPWGNDHNSVYYQKSSAGEPFDDFIPLNDEDLKPQFKELSYLHANKDLGEAGVPSGDQFYNPSAALASIFSPVFFDTNMYAIHNNDREGIQKIAAYLKKNPATSIIIEGHCDERGPEAYNQALGTKRANAVKEELIKKGVNPTQLHTISYGKEKPFAIGHTKDDWAKNRRAHFRIHKQP